MACLIYVLVVCVWSPYLVHAPLWFNQLFLTVIPTTASPEETAMFFFMLIT